MLEEDVAVRRLAIEVRGVVQGVGYRPFVVALARRLGLAGDVANVGGRVDIDVEGESDAVDEFIDALSKGAPAAAQVREVSTEPRSPGARRGFTVRASTEQAGAAFVTPDRAACAACARDLEDPASRRHGYPFAACNACGPRWTVVLGAPYARARTTMAPFPPCAACARDLEDATGRHFLAEATACADCGPRLRFTGATAVGAPDGPLERATAAVRSGLVVAIKGVGGYHLACDAADAAVVARLRERKARDAKPFAVLVADLEAAAALARLDDDERRELESPMRPIVLVRRRDGAPLADEVAPRSPWVGLLLPPSLLHLALVRAVARPIVLTSGNRGGEPMAIDEASAVERLGDVADAFLHHDRGIAVRVDDSVVRVVRGKTLPVRRGRGLAPAPIRLRDAVAEPILALGGDFKGAFAIAVGEMALVSHHVGDLGDVDATLDLERCLEHVERLLGVRPRIVAHDLHPDYASTHLAHELAARRGGRTVAVAHHHAHVASCLADAGHAGPVIGFAFDGVGLGVDGTAWGGEVLVGDARHVDRVAHLRAVALPGGDAAARAPWRAALAHLVDAGVSTARLAGLAPPGDRELLERAVRAGVGAPRATSMGRLFDAVACLSGQRALTSYDGQAAMELEGAAACSDATGAYTFDVTGRTNDGPDEIDARPVVRAVAADVDAGEGKGAIALRFHRALADAVTTVAVRVRERGGPSVVALGGGVFVNAVLVAACEERLERHGFTVLRPRRVPPNDGGLALGQLLIAAARTGGA